MAVKHNTHLVILTPQENLTGPTSKKKVGGEHTRARGIRGGRVNPRGTRLGSGSDSGGPAAGIGGYTRGGGGGPRTGERGGGRRRDGSHVMEKQTIDDQLGQADTFKFV